MRGLWHALAITALLVWTTRCSPAARAEELCRDEGANVVCPKQRFSRLVQRTVEFDTNLQLCRADLKACQSERDEVQRRLDEALAVPCPPPPKAPAAIAPAAGYALGVAGLLAAGLVPVIPGIPDGWRVAANVASAAAVGAGALLVVPLP